MLKTKSLALSLAAVALIGGAATACGSTTSAATSTHASNSSPGPSRPAPTQDHAYAKAKKDWKATGHAPLASVDVPMRRAVKDLKTANDPDFASAIRHLKDFIDLPGTDLTAAEQKRARTDRGYLDKFFGTPGI